MSPTKVLEAFGNDIYLILKSRFYDEIEGEDGQVYLNQVISWTNMFIDELTFEVDPQTNDPVDWWFLRQSNYTLGTAVEGAASISLASKTDIDRVLTDGERYVQIEQDGIVVSNWVVVSAKNITNKQDRVTEDMCAVVGTSLVFSRPFRDTEAGGTITGDVTIKIPYLSRTNVKALSLVSPVLLLKLGVAKNASLPDIVQGGLSPSFSQKYADLLGNAITRSRASSRAEQVQREDLSHIQGV